MAQQTPDQTQSFFGAFVRPAWVVMMVVQMLLGLGLFVGLVLKYYMVVFSQEICTPDGETLGNMIRCTATLEMTAHFVFGVAGIRLAAALFTDDPRALIQPLMIGVLGVLLMYLSGVTLAGASWSVAVVLLALLGCFSVLFAGLYLKFFQS